jgi:hypothetical protein
MLLTPSDIVERPYERFDDFPSQDFVDQVAAHLKETGQPETMEALYRERIARDEPFLIVTDISINRLKRPEEDRAPCPRCYQSNKFLQGFLIYIPRLKACAVVGNECASSEAGEAANADYERRKAEAKAESEYERLFNELPLVPARLSTLASAERVADEAESLRKAFRRDAEAVYRALEAVVKSGGDLKAEQGLGESDGAGPRGLSAQGSAALSQTITFGPLRGQIIVSRTFRPARMLREMQTMLRLLIPPDGDSLAFMDKMGVQGRRDALKALRRSEKDFEGFMDGIADLKAFLLPDNFDRMHRWGQHPGSPIYFNCKLTRGPATYQIYMDWHGHRFDHSVGAALFQPIDRVAFLRP